MSSQSDDLAALRAAIRDVLTTQADRTSIRRFIDGAAAMDVALWTQAAELGWFSLTIPEVAGGLGAGVSAGAVLFEELGRAVAPLPAIGTILAAECITRGGNNAQRATFLPGLAAGNARAAFALPADGTLHLSASHVLSGSIDLVIDAASAKLAVLPATNAAGELMFLVLDLTAKNVTVEPQGMADLTRQAARISISGLQIEHNQLLSGDLRSLTATMTGIAGLLLAADSLGAAQSIFDQTVDYLKTREQFGKPIGSFQALKHRAADHHVAMTGARALLENAAALWDLGSPDAGLHAALCKAHICDLAETVAIDAVQMHGGIGFTWEHECHLFLKRILLNSQLFGTTAAHFDLALTGLGESFVQAA
jgi:alkylation response protein AidB-like acyl-CoA dehydrogenase